MYPIEAFRSTVERFVSILTSLDIGYHLTGGVVSVAWGDPRLTQDIDIVVDRVAVASRIDFFLAAIREAGFFADEQAIRSAIATGRPFQLLDPVEVLKLDVYPRELIPGELSRSVLVEVFSGVSLFIVSRTDAALSKLIWIGKGSHKSRHDLRHIMRRLSDEEFSVVQQKAGELHLLDLFTSVLDEADEIVE